jgi:hypothetical protein
MKNSYFEELLETIHFVLYLILDDLIRPCVREVVARVFTVNAHFLLPALPTLKLLT